MPSPMLNKPTYILRKMLEAAIASAQSDVCLPNYLPKAIKGRTIVIGAGKASAHMARTFEQNFKGDITGLVVTQYGYAVKCEKIDIIEAAHPTPDAASKKAAKQILKRVAGLSAEDQVVCLISGGGSSLLALPAPGIALRDKQRIGAALLKRGATISEINCVRRHLSDIKGGKLAKACYPAQLTTLLISDVPGDDPADIASGLTAGDSTTCADALDIIKQYKVKISDSIQDLLEKGQTETIKPEDALFKRNIVQLIATPQMALEAAAQYAHEQQLQTHVLSDRIEGEASEVGSMMAELSHQIMANKKQIKMPCVVLSGGETTVKVKGNGKGGRNVEFLLAMAIALNGKKRVYALAADTDGIDGKEEIAGAIITPTTLQRAHRKNLDAQAFLDNNDAHSFFTALGDSVITGPTHTNVNDFRAVILL